ncbi:DUF4241 domain-containing protein [Sedimentibacter sp. zth1]|uniref:DUF4241 domain-containing protein n=1 Tax=Sedimentibacter sp. zth1 TaxID=2816908 RepID=UPI001A930F62|nr:DUF4241 domain-containing protein [Sedimentibacter sp. zth1]QSX06953.1 DUF4241 domain-containing protein [Sedimentibacter sp. zth1]
MYINNYALNLTNEQSLDIETDFGKATMIRHNIGKLILKTGNIIATDPILLYDDQPYYIKVKPAEYPVYVFTANFENGENKTALSKIEFSKEKPVKWEMALYEGERSNNLKNDEYLGFDVENGICAYMDDSIMEELDTLFEKDLEEYENLIKANVIYNKKELKYQSISYGNNGCNIIVFTSGWKDGTFPSYYGYDKNNKVCCLVTDFMVFE